MNSREKGSLRLKKLFENYKSEILINVSKRLIEYHKNKGFDGFSNTITSEDDTILFLHWYLKYAHRVLNEYIKGYTIEELIMKLDIIGF